MIDFIIAAFAIFIVVNEIIRYVKNRGKIECCSCPNAQKCNKCEYERNMIK